jgi:hypothetical protein
MANSWSIEARKARWKKFMSPDSPPGYMLMARYDEPEVPPVPPWPAAYPEKKRERIEWALALYEHQMKQAAWLHDDFIPYLFMNTGTEIFAEAFGCRVHRPEGSNPCAIPLITSASEVAALKVPDLSAPSLAILFEMADELRRRAGPEALMRTVDIQSPMDIAALIWDKNTFFIGLLDAPEAVKELADKVHRLLTAFLDEWFRRYGTEHIAHHPDYYMDGGMTLSEDEVGAVNEDMFEEFFLGELSALSRRYGGIGMHCCANSRHQWEGFHKIHDLRLLNLYAPPTKTSQYIKDAFAFFDTRVAQMHYGWALEGPVETWPQQYPKDKKIVVDWWPSSKEEAIRGAAAFAEATHKLNP